jgi:signal transduction histidine kinase
LVQAYWLNNAYTLKKEKFNRDVITALSEVAERLDNLEATRFLTESFKIEPFFTDKLSPFFGTSHSGADSAGNTPSGASLKLTLRMGGDTVIEFNNKNTRATLKGYRFKDSLSQDTILQSSPESMAQKAMQLDLMLRKLIVHETRRKGLNHVINAKTLDSLISHEFKANGVKLPYEYAILGKDTVRQASANWQKEQKQYQVSLFPNDFFTNQKLSVSFPKRANYLLESMWIMLLVSLFFTSAIVVAFYRTLRFSLQQKRISDIKTDFINNMTHEFKTPIATINLAIDALRSPKIIADPQKVHHYSYLIKQENNRMNMQVESVLRMALMDKQELELNLKMVAINDLVKDAIDHFALRLENRGGQLNKFLNTHNIRLKADENHLSNVIINLLDNALKYSPNKPHIKVATEITSNYFILTVADNGLGMTKDEQKHIFDRFYRVSAGDLHNIKGHGLGLSYVKGIIEGHGGRIEVESEKGRGSKFYIYLPLNN